MEIYLTEKEHFQSRYMEFNIEIMTPIWKSGFHFWGTILQSDRWQGCYEEVVGPGGGIPALCCSTA